LIDFFKSYFLDLKKADIELWKLFYTEISPFLESFTIGDALFAITKVWRKERKIKGNMAVFFCVDEIVRLSSAEERRSLLEVIKCVNGTNDCVIFKIITSIAPSAIFDLRDIAKLEFIESKYSQIIENRQDIKKLNSNPSSSIINKLLTGSEYIWYYMQRLETFEEFIKTLKENDKFKNKFNSNYELRLLEVIFYFSCGHFRTLQFYVEQLDKMNSLEELTWSHVLNISFPSSEVVNFDIFWRWVPIVILNLQCKLGDSMEKINTDDKVLEFLVSDFVHFGLLIPEKKIIISSYFEKETLVEKMKTTSGFLYSYASHLKVDKNSFLAKALERMKLLLCKCVMYANTYNQPKYFELFVMYFWCLSFQLRSMIAASSGKSATKSTGKDLKTLSCCDSVDVMDFFQNTLELAKCGNSIKFVSPKTMKLKLLFGVEPLLFNVDDDSGLNRSLIDRFTTTKDFELNTFYASSFKNEPGIEGFFGLETTDNNVVYILLQCKLNFDLSTNKYSISSENVNNALNNAVTFQKRVNKIKIVNQGNMLKVPMSNNNTIFLFVGSNTTITFNQVNQKFKNNFLLVAKLERNIKDFFGSTFFPFPLFSKEYESKK
jgi:hypothetical protein